MLFLRNFVIYIIHLSYSYDWLECQLKLSFNCLLIVLLIEAIPLSFKIFMWQFPESLCIESQADITRLYVKVTSHHCQPAFSLCYFPFYNLTIFSKFNSIIPVFFYLSMLFCHGDCWHLSPWQPNSSTMMMFSLLIVEHKNQIFWHHIQCLYSDMIHCFNKFQD